VAPSPIQVWPLALGTGQPTSASRDARVWPSKRAGSASARWHHVRAGAWLPPRAREASTTWRSGLNLHKGRQPQRQVSPHRGSGWLTLRATQRHMVIGSNPAQRQVNLSVRCPHVGAQTWLTPRKAPPKLEVTIFSPIIPSMPNASQ